MGLPENCGLRLPRRFPQGRRNLITDVPGVTVGHVSLRDGACTGVTAILPHRGNLFLEKVTGKAPGWCRWRSWGPSSPRF